MICCSLDYSRSGSERTATHPHASFAGYVLLLINNGLVFGCYCIDNVRRKGKTNVPNLVSHRLPDIFQVGQVYIHEVGWKEAGTKARPALIQERSRMEYLAGVCMKFAPCGGLTSRNPLHTVPSPR